MSTDRKQQVLALLKSIETGDAAPVAFIDPAAYRQHNLAVGDGLAGFGEALAAMAEAGVTMRYERVHRVLGEGDFVLVASEGQFAGEHVAFYDLFRVAGRKIVEHWDTIEAIPPRSAWKNDNDKF